ncbi:MAG: hypothetical protein ACE5D7_06915 [Fidelibacterota bacterium]
MNRQDIKMGGNEVFGSKLEMMKKIHVSAFDKCTDMSKFNQR